MLKVYKSLKAILLFLIILLVSQTAGGDKFAQNMTLVILFSMLVLNADKIATFTTAIAGNLTD